MVKVIGARLAEITAKSVSFCAGTCRFTALEDSVRVAEGLKERVHSMAGMAPVLPENTRKTERDKPIWLEKSSNTDQTGVLSPV